MGDVTSLPQPPDLVDSMIGPRSVGYQAIIEGRAIPGLTLYEEGEDVSLVLDNRLSITVPRDMAHQVAWFAATALALGQGYSHIGGQTKDRPFAPKAFHLGAVPE